MPDASSPPPPNLALPRLGLGCMGFTEFYGDDSAAADPDAIVGRALDLGVTLIDTADAYGPFRNEEAVGRALRGKRHRAVLATKFGVDREAGDASGISGRLNGKPDFVKRACEASLQRLGCDVIDLYYMHRLDPETPVEETAGALAELVREGKIRHYGLCEVGAETLRRANAVHPVSALQSEFSLWHRDPEALFPDLAALGVPLVNYSPLGRGFLSGRIRSIDDLAKDDWRRLSPRFQGENFDRNLAVVDAVRDLADAKGCTTAQLALAWCRAAPVRVVPLTGATTVEQLEENAASLDVVLSREEVAAIERAAPAGAFGGESWPPGSVGGRVEKA